MAAATILCNKLQHISTANVTFVFGCCNIVIAAAVRNDHVPHK